MKLASKTASVHNVSVVLSFLFSLAICLTPVPVSAQSEVWRIDQEHSVARLSLGAGAQSLEPGIAHVDGSALFDPADPVGARFVLTIQRDNAEAPQYSEITFEPKRSRIDRAGILVVAGDLTVTRVVRAVQVDANEGYHGAQYGEPVAYTNTREVTLVFPDVKSAPSLDRAIRLSASATVHAEDFPLLQAALQSGDWPTVVVEDRQSAPVSTVGEDYAGFPSSGTPVVTAPTACPSPVVRPIAPGSDLTPSFGN